MSFWDILGTLLIKPLQLLFEVVFVMAKDDPRKPVGLIHIHDLAIAS